MHVHAEPDEIQHHPPTHHEATEPRAVALRIDSGTDRGWAAADVDLLDDIGTGFDGEDVRRAIVVGAAEYALPIRGNRAPNGKIIVIVDAILAPFDPVKEHTTDMRNVTKRGQLAQIHGEHNCR